MEDQIKKCPYCGETILEVAIKCKQCGSMLNDSNKGKITFTFVH